MTTGQSSLDGGVFHIPSANPHGQEMCINVGAPQGQPCAPEVAHMTFEDMLIAAREAFLCRLILDKVNERGRMANLAVFIASAQTRFNSVHLSTAYRLGGNLFLRVPFGIYYVEITYERTRLTITVDRVVSPVK